MDAVGAAASLTALATLALQSAKLIHETISSIQEAVPNVSHLGKAIGHLRALLERCITDAESGHDGDQQLKTLLQHCGTELKEFEAFLEKLLRGFHRSSFKKIGSRLRAVLDEKKIGTVEKTTILPPSEHTLEPSISRFRSGTGNK